VEKDVVEWKKKRRKKEAVREVGGGRLLVESARDKGLARASLEK
jgi:hypothetical protein